MGLQEEYSKNISKYGVEYRKLALGWSKLYEKEFNIMNYFNFFHIYKFTSNKIKI